MSTTLTVCAALTIAASSVQLIFVCLTVKELVQAARIRRRGRE